MFKPISDFMIVERYALADSKIMLPDSAGLDAASNAFIVKAIGPGYRTDEGKVIAPDVKENDLVFIAGKIIRFKFEGQDINMARAGDVIAVNRNYPKPQPALSTKN